MLNADVEVDRRDFTVRVAFAVAPGERLALFGPSGAGKTTVLEIIAGLVPPRRGTVELGGRVLTQTAPPRIAVPPWRRRVGLLRQDPALFPHLSVRQNLTYAPGAASRGAEIGQIAGRLGISGLLGDRPARLSGGQAHRVALAVHGKPQHASRQLIGLDGGVADRLKRQPRFVEGGFEDHQRLWIERATLETTHGLPSRHCLTSDVAMSRNLGVGQADTTAVAND